MDLEAAAHKLRLDLLAKEVSDALSLGGIPHVLLKGPSTADWLYDPPRAYRDVDLLIRATQFQGAARLIADKGLATRAAGRLGEEAAHSLVMMSTNGYELDLHITLPMLSPRRYRDPDRLWRVFSPHMTTMSLLGDTSIPVLGIPGRCVVLTLHALASGYQSEQVREDLRRAKGMAGEDAWRQAQAIAEELGILDLFRAGLVVADPGQNAAPVPVDAYLKRTDAVGPAFGLQRLLDAPLRAKPRLLLRELFPTVGFIRHAYPASPQNGLGLAALYFQRWTRLARQLPQAIASLREANRQARG